MNLHGGFLLTELVSNVSYILGNVIKCYNVKETDKTFKPVKYATVLKNTFSILYEMRNWEILLKFN